MDSNEGFAPVTNVDVLIVGGGMAGGMLAAALANTELTIAVVDAAQVPEFPHGDAEVRVSAITEASFNMLTNVGAWQHLPQDRLSPYSSMDVWDADGTGRVTFDAASARASQLGWIIENSAVTAALYSVCQTKNVDWRASSKITSIVASSEGWSATLESGEKIITTLLVGADGARSQVREKAGIAAAPKDSGHRAIVATIETELAHGGCARQRFMQTGPLAMLPLFGDGHRFSLVWSTSPELAQALMAMTDEEFSSALTIESEGVLGACREITKRAAFPIHTLHASEYAGPRLALIGDAAHVVHPLAGQGINLGFLDAAVLSEEIHKAMQRGIRIADETVLKRYQRRRRAHNALMLKSLNGIKHLFAVRDPAIRFMRNVGMSLVNKLPPAKAFFASEALGRNGDLPQLALRELKPE
ncbi:MAG: UbiH/UbiF/VisC/COQ6 family ubiquinone biosynthesis hydroxylase [Alcanivoracaceae bacterium]|nr:UbiH/UbiF/VisC/COQ6 family ubiquinone biosynthesis hydroxylase [Alcanivoracaceae bacterium]